MIDIQLWVAIYILKNEKYVCLVTIKKKKIVKDPVLISKELCGGFTY